MLGWRTSSTDHGFSRWFRDLDTALALGPGTTHALQQKIEAALGLRADIFRVYAISDY
jgi:hypothetical protein